jgi:hypothetical protein
MISAQCDMAPEVNFVTGTHAHGHSTRRTGTLADDDLTPHPLVGGVPVRLIRTLSAD